MRELINRQGHSERQYLPCQYPPPPPPPPPPLPAPVQQVVSRKLGECTSSSHCTFITQTWDPAANESLQCDPNPNQSPYPSFTQCPHALGIPCSSNPQSLLRGMPCVRCRAKDEFGLCVPSNHRSDLRVTYECHRIALRVPHDYPLSAIC